MILDEAPGDLYLASLQARPVVNRLQTPFVSGSVSLDAVYDVVVTLAAGGATGRGYGTAFSLERAALLAGTAANLANACLGRPLAEWDAAGMAARARCGDDVGAAPLIEHAIGIADIAFFDLLGNLTGKTTRQLLGAVRPRLPYYASGGSLTDGPNELTSFFARAAMAGTRLVKIKVDGADPAAAVTRTTRAAALLPPGLRLAVDANQTFSARGARDFATRVSSLDPPLAWLEEPLPADDILGLARLHQDIDIPLAAGETLFGERAVLHLVEDQAADRLILSVARHGGVAAFRRLGDAATSAGMSVKSHVNPHLCAQITPADWNDPMLEYLPWWDHYFRSDAYLMEAGTLSPTGAAPGFGFLDTQGGV